MEELLRTEKVTKRYAKHTALEQVSISVPQQSIYGLLGPNGAGKTSLIRIINQITGPDNGAVYFENERLKPHHIAQIGYLPEERGLYKKMKVGEQALYLARLKGLDRKEASFRLKQWFKKFDILPWWDKKIEELSKGMAQKVQFIVTVLHRPKLLILDEPFSGFDPINADLIKSEILQLRDEGTTIIFSTHNMNSVEEVCDRIALINNSKKILEGAVQEIKDQFKSNIFDITFKGNVVGFTNALWTGAELLNSEKKGDLIKAQVRLLNGTTPNQLLQAVIPHTEVFSLNEIIPSMNEIFIKKVTEIGEPIPDENQ